MSADGLNFFSIYELAQQIESKEISPREVVDAHLRHIEALNPELNAFITVCADGAREDAKKAEDEIQGGNYRGPLHGIPVGIKDIVDTEGVLTTQGSSFFPENVPAEDAECVKRLKKAGAVIIGKCNTHEFAAGSTTVNPHYGPCRNPWNTERVAGGSSGGSGASVAAFMCPAAVGTDTGGSIRGPASACGTMGLKPTYGRVSLRGIFPNSPSLDHAGPLARTARDCGLMLQAMAGYDPADPGSEDRETPDFCALIGRGVEGMRFGLCEDLHLSENDESVQKGFEQAIETLKGLGGVITHVRYPHAEQMNEVRGMIAGAELAVVHRERFSTHPEMFGEDVRDRLESVNRVTLDDYVRACRERRIVTREMEKVFGEIDILLAPGYPCPAAPIATTMGSVNGVEVPFSGLGRPQTGPYNLFGFPAMAAPSGFSADGLPVSVQFVGPPWEEARVLQASHAYEEATPDIRREKPPMFGG